MPKAPHTCQDAVREALRRTGMSQRGLALKSGIAQPSLAKWLAPGSDISITTKTLDRLMAATGMTFRLPKSPE